MNSNVLVGLACCAALALGACSGGSSATSGRAAGDPGSESGGAVSPAAVTAVRTANNGEPDAGGTTAMQTAERLVAAATSAAQRAVAENTPAARTAAREAIAAARSALDAVVMAAQAAVDAVDAADGAAARGAAQRSLAQANTYKARTETALDDLGRSYAWYGRDLVRYTFTNGAVQVPGDGTNTARIVRIPRTVTVDGNQVFNEGQQEGIKAAFTSETFSLVMYEDGKRVFSVADDAEGGDEFRVNGYVAANTNLQGVLGSTWTALKLTDEGIVIRTGGTSGDTHIFAGDFTDMRRDITKWANASTEQVAQRDTFIETPQGFSIGNHLPGQNGWDLEITFDEPRTKSIANRGDTSWAGNGDFYWKSLVLPDPSQLDKYGRYYNSLAFFRRAINTVPRAVLPEEYRNLGTYQVWLSNHVDFDTNFEPAPGAGAITYPDDDVNRYLQYSAYGLFLYTANRATFRQQVSTWWNGWNGHVGRINTLHFGYSAFADEDGKRITDIGQAITNGIFRGYTLVHEVRADNNTDENGGDNFGEISGIATKFLRGDVTLTVNIPKGSGLATVEGTMNNFQEWYADTYWKEASNNESVALNRATIDANGTFGGGMRITGGTFYDNGNGVYKGSFYGPRADKNDLEIAGSWTNGDGAGSGNDQRTWFGAFGAKQVPPTSD